MRIRYGVQRAAIGVAVAGVLVFAGTTTAFADEEPAPNEVVEVAAGDAVAVSIELEPGDAQTAEVSASEVPVTAALNCGWNVSSSSSTGFMYTYYNCNSIAVSFQPDYLFVDGPCRLVTPYSTNWWYISLSPLNPWTGNMISC